MALRMILYPILNSTRCKAINPSEDSANGGAIAVPVLQTTSS